jgi:hypothetical protein
MIALVPPISIWNARCHFNPCPLNSIFYRFATKLDKKQSITLCQKSRQRLQRLDFSKVSAENWLPIKKFRSFFTLTFTALQRKKLIFAFLFFPFLLSNYFCKEACAAPGSQVYSQTTLITDRYDQSGHVKILDGTIVISGQSRQLSFVNLPIPEKFEARRQETIERLRYSFSKLISASLPRKLAVLAAASLVLVLIGGSLFVLTGKTNSWKEAMFRAYTLLNNVPGGSAVDESNTLHLIAANALFVIGVLSFAVVLGAVSSSMEEELEAVMHGSGRVAERGHILLLNSNRKTVPVVRMIDGACKDGMPCAPVVILTSENKVAALCSAFLCVRFAVYSRLALTLFIWRGTQEELDDQLRKGLRNPMVQVRTADERSRPGHPKCVAS